jgi:hypothetical protein
MQMELVTGYLSADELEHEFSEIARILSRTDFPVLVVTYGGGCNWSQVSTDAHPAVSSLLLPEFMDQQEQIGIFLLGGRNEVVFDTDDGRLQFLLCEASEIHCKTEEVTLFNLFCDRWGELYPDAYEWDKENSLMRLLSGLEWKPF